MEDVKMKVCKANEMRKAAEKPSKVLNRLYKFIRETAEEGNVEGDYNFVSISSSGLNYIVSDLEKNGFKCHVYQEYFDRDVENSKQEFNLADSSGDLRDICLTFSW